jgi:hypothetical protein
MTMTAGAERVRSIPDVGVEDIALVGNKAATFEALRRLAVRSSGVDQSRGPDRIGRTW